MSKLTNKELKEEYVRSLKAERLEVGLVGFMLIGAWTYLTLLLAKGMWNLLIIIPMFCLVLLIRKIEEITRQIKDNKKW